MEGQRAAQCGLSSYLPPAFEQRLRWNVAPYQDSGGCQDIVGSNPSVFLDKRSKDTARRLNGHLVWCKARIKVMRRQEAHDHKQAQIREGKRAKNPRAFDYSLNYKQEDLRKYPDLYRVGVGEQGVLLVEPYKSEILPYWKFATPEKATESSVKIKGLFDAYLSENDFVGADMARKFLQMGFTRASRYANHRGGRKYTNTGLAKPRDEEDASKAASAKIFLTAWKQAEAVTKYAEMKQAWKKRLG